MGGHRRSKLFILKYSRYFFKENDLFVWALTTQTLTRTKTLRLNLGACAETKRQSHCLAPFAVFALSHRSTRAALVEPLPCPQLVPSAAPA